MNKLIAILLAGVFSAVSFSALADDMAAPAADAAPAAKAAPAKHAKKHKKAKKEMKEEKKDEMKAPEAK